MKRIAFILASVILIMLFCYKTTQASDESVRWINQDTVQIQFVADEEYNTVCYAVRNSLFRNGILTIGCIEPDTENVIFNFNNGPDFRYHPLVGDEFRITTFTSTEVLRSEWLVISNNKPFIVALPVITR